MTRIFHWIMCKMDPKSGFDIRQLCLHYRPVTVHCSTKDEYTSEITFLALVPWVKASSNLKLLYTQRNSFCHTQNVQPLYLSNVMVDSRRIYSLKYLRVANRKRFKNVDLRQKLKSPLQYYFISDSYWF